MDARVGTEARWRATADLQRPIRPEATDLAPERHHEPHAESGRAPWIVRAREIALKVRQGHVMPARVHSADDVHHHVAVRLDVSAGLTYPSIDARKLGRRVVRLLDQGQQSADVAVPYASLRCEDARPHESGVAVVDGHHGNSRSTRARLDCESRHRNRGAGKDRDQPVPAASHRSTYPEAVGPVTAIGAPAMDSVRSSGLTISAKWQALG